MSGIIIYRKLSELIPKIKDNKFGIAVFEEKENGEIKVLSKTPLGWSSLLFECSDGSTAIGISKAVFDNLSINSNDKE